MNISEITCKSILTPSKLPDADYVINPYTGCQHGCVYCYAEFMRKYTNHEEAWGDFIDIKINSAELVKCSKKYKGKRILIGSVTDAYTPIENKYGITRSILRKLLSFDAQIEILTKSKLVLRDIDLLKQFQDVTVGFSISTTNKDYCNMLEPKATIGKFRIKALEKLHDAGIKTYLFVSPIFPEITDIDELIGLASPYADYLMFENLNVRKNNRDSVFEFIKHVRPDLYDFYEEVFGGSKKPHTYWIELKQSIEEKCKNQNIEARVYFQHIGIT